LKHTHLPRCPRRCRRLAVLVHLGQAGGLLRGGEGLELAEVCKVGLLGDLLQGGGGGGTGTGGSADDGGGYGRGEWSPASSLHLAAMPAMGHRRLGVEESTNTGEGERGRGREGEREREREMTTQVENNLVVCW